MLVVTIFQIVINRILPEDREKVGRPFYADDFTTYYTIKSTGNNSNTTEGNKENKSY